MDWVNGNFNERVTPSDVNVEVRGGGALDVLREAERMPTISRPSNLLLQYSTASVLAPMT